MNFSSKGGSTDFTPLPAGSHFAVVDQIVDLGIQKGSAMYPDPKHKIFIRWQVPKQRVKWKDKQGVEKEGPRVISKQYTASMHENANLRADLVSWRGRDFTDDEASAFDISKILGKPCLISVVHSNKGGKTYANIASISAMPEGMEPPKVEGDLVLFDPNNQSKDEADRQFELLPDWLKKTINSQLRDEDQSQERTDDNYWSSDPNAAAVADQETPF